MNTFLLLIWIAIGVTMCFSIRLMRLVKAAHGEGHWLTTLVAMAGILMIFSWTLAAFGFLAGDWSRALTWIAAAVYVALSIAVTWALGPDRDATPLLKHFPATARPMPAAYTRDDQSEIEL